MTAKCYGGEVTRRRKLLEKRKEGKKRIRQFSKVDIPQEAFVSRALDRRLIELVTALYCFWTSFIKR